MTTAVKPLAPHGTTARAKGRPAAGVKGCPCRPCRDAENAYDKRRRVLNETGRTLMVDAAPAQEYLTRLFAEGAGWIQLAAATTVSTSTLQAILRGEREEITRRVASRILDIANASPLDLATVRYITNGRPKTISARTAAGVAAAYQALAGHTGSSVRSLNRAERENWRNPLWWEDMGRIDDPDFDPDTADVISFRERATLRREEIVHLAWCGHEPEHILDRLDGEVSISTIRQIVQDWRTGQKRDRKKAAA